MPINFSNFIACPPATCPAVVLPSIAANECECELFSGRINDLYFIDCSAEFSDVNIIDTAWWQGLIDDDLIFKLGVGIGGYAKKNSTSFDAGGAGSPTIESIEWALKYQIFCVDKGTAMSTHAFANALIGGATRNYNVVARFCDGDNMILPIGKVDVSDFDNSLPDAVDQFMSFSYEFSWKSLQVPTPLSVAGLNAILPKATRG